MSVPLLARLIKQDVDDVARHVTPKPLWRTARKVRAGLWWPLRAFVDVSFYTAAALGVLAGGAALFLLLMAAGGLSVMGAGWMILCASTLFQAGAWLHAVVIGACVGVSAVGYKYAQGRLRQSKGQ